MKCLSVLKWLLGYWICHSTVQASLVQPNISSSVTTPVNHNFVTVSNKSIFQDYDNSTDATLKNINANSSFGHSTESPNEIQVFIEHLTPLGNGSGSCTENATHIACLEKKMSKRTENKKIDPKLVRQMLSKQHLLRSYFTPNSKLVSVGSSRIRRGLFDNSDDATDIANDKTPSDYHIYYKYNSPSFKSKAAGLDAEVPMLRPWKPFVNSTVTMNQYPYHGVHVLYRSPTMNNSFVIPLIEEYGADRAYLMQGGGLDDDGMSRLDLPEGVVQDTKKRRTELLELLPNGGYNRPTIEYFSAEFLIKYCCLQKPWAYYTDIHVFGRHIYLSDSEARYAAYLINHRKIPKKETFDLELYVLLGSMFRNSMPVDENLRRLNSYYGLELTYFNFPRGVSFRYHENFKLLDHPRIRPNIWSDATEYAPDYTC